MCNTFLKSPQKGESKHLKKGAVIKKELSQQAYIDIMFPSANIN